MEEEFISAYDEVEEKEYLDSLTDMLRHYRYHLQSSELSKYDIARIKKLKIAAAAAKELIQLSKEVSTETFNKIINNSLKVSNVRSYMFDKLNEQSSEFSSAYDAALETFQTEFLHENLNLVDTESLIDVVHDTIGNYGDTAELIDVMKLDVNAPERFRHQATISTWKDVTKTDVEVKKWNDPSICDESDFLEEMADLSIRGSIVDYDKSKRLYGMSLARYGTIEDHERYNKLCLKFTLACLLLHGGPLHARILNFASQELIKDVGLTFAYINGILLQTELPDKAFEALNKINTTNDPALEFLSKEFEKSYWTLRKDSLPLGN